MNQTMPLALQIVLRILDRLHKQNSDYRCAVVGQSGTGKSWLTMALAEVIDEDFTPEKRTFFTLEALLAALSLPAGHPDYLKQGSVIILDEAGVSWSSRKWYSDINTAMSSVLQVVRCRNLCLFMVLPNIALLDSVGRNAIHAFITTLRIDRKERVCHARWQEVKINHTTGKVTKPYYRDNEGRRIISMAIGEPWEEHVKTYEGMKATFVSQTIASAQDTIETQKAWAEWRREKAGLPPVRSGIEADIKAGIMTPKEIAEKHGTKVGYVYQVRGSISSSSLTYTKSNKLTHKDLERAPPAAANSAASNIERASPNKLTGDSKS